MKTAVREDIRQHVSNDYLRQTREESSSVRNLLGELELPEEEVRRIHELAGKIGFFPTLWARAIRALYNVIDDDPRVLLILHGRVRTMRRFSVDVGDVLGEAYATLLLGRMYLIDKQYKIAVEEFLRVIELNRIVSRPDLELEAKRWLKYCTADPIDRDYMERIQPFLQQSMWGQSLR